jgi:hypothetical protein
MTRPLDPVTAALTNPASRQQPITQQPVTAPPAVQVAAPQNIDPNASAPAPAAPTAPAAPAATPATQTQSQAPSLGAPAAANGNYSLDQILAAPAAQVQQANIDVAQTWDQIKTAQQTVAQYQASTNPLDQQKLAGATSTLNSLYTSLSASESRLESANTAYSTALLKGIDSVQLTPEQKSLYSAQADNARAQAAQANANAKVITDGSEGQRALASAQAGLASANAAAAEATARATAAKTPAETNQLNAQADALRAQAASTNALLPGLAAKQQAETGLTVAQTDLTSANSAFVQAQTVSEGAKGRLADAQASLSGAQATQLVPAQAGLAGAQAGLAGAQTAASQAGVQKDLLGPMYGLQDQINAIRSIQQQVFGPGGSGDPEHANQLLQDYLQATVGGTTPYAASVAAANYGQNQYATQASMYNAAQQALSTRANALSGLAGNVLGTLSPMNANAPAGSTAMAAAFRDVMNFAASQQAAAQQQFAQQLGQPGGTLQQPTPPALPGYLARFAGGTPPAGPGPGPQTSAPVTINIGGAGGATSAPAVSMPSMPPAPPPTLANQAPGQNYGASTAYTGGVAPWNAQPGGGGGQPAAPQLPASLQGYSLGTTGSLQKLWSNELGSGAVQMPTYTAPPSVPGVM